MSSSHLHALDRAHVWHPFTPMKQWCENEQLIIERAEGFELIDTQGRRYIDGVSSLWCNVHGHRVPEIDQAIREQLDKVAHSTLLGLGNEPSVLLAAELVRRAPRAMKDGAPTSGPITGGPLNKVFYSDAGATAVEAALKMAVGYWHHRGQSQRKSFIALGGAYHGDTVGSMSVGFSDLFHRAFATMVFPVHWSPAPDALRAPAAVGRLLREMKLDLCAECGSTGECGLKPWPSECVTFNAALSRHCLNELESILRSHSAQTAAIVIEPVMQGAAGMIAQPAGFLRNVADLARKHGVLLIADEVATGFGRTGAMFACELEGVCPDILCVAKGLTAGYLPVAATLTTDEIYNAFTGELADRRTFYHGHTFTGNPLGCAAALANLRLFDRRNLVAHARASAEIIRRRLGDMKDPRKLPHVVDIRQRGLMVGIELAKDRQTREPFDFSRTIGARMCLAMRPKGLIIRPLGSVLVLMPAPAMDHATLDRMLDIVIETVAEWREECQRA